MSKPRAVLVYCQAASHSNRRVKIAYWEGFRLKSKWHVALVSRLNEDNPEGYSRTTILDSAPIDPTLVFGTSRRAPSEEYFGRISETHEKYELRCKLCGLTWRRHAIPANALGLRLIEHEVPSVALEYLVKDHSD